MRVAFTVLVSLVLCLSCAPSPSGDSESTAKPRNAAADETAALHIRESVNYYEAGDFERSLQAAEEAVRYLDAQSAVAYNNICSAHIKLGDFERAAQACNRALEIVPGHELARNNLAWVYERVVEQTPTAEAYLNLSLVRYGQDRLDESVAAAQQALELDPDSAMAHNNICAAFAKGGQWDRAVSECETALKIDPDYELATNNLEWARTRGAEPADPTGE